jgi:hypothetical protein
VASPPFSKAPVPPNGTLVYETGADLARCNEVEAVIVTNPRCIAHARTLAVFNAFHPSLAFRLICVRGL